MKALLLVLKDFKQFFTVKTTKGKMRLLMVIVLLIVAAYFLKPSTDTIDDSLQQIRSVSTATVSSFSDSASTQLIGTVSSIDQASIQTEISGRVTSVEVSLGQTVSPGQIIARLENASAYAAVLQAEGVYEGAIASAEISNVSVSDAENNLRRVQDSAYGAYVATYSTLRDIYQSDLDVIVADPENTFRTPGANLKDTTSRIYEVDAQFKKIGALLAKDLAIDSSIDAVLSLLEDAQITSELMLDLIKNLQSLIDDDEVRVAYGSTELAYLATLSSAQSQIDATLLSLKTSKTSLAAAKVTLEKSKLGGTSGTVSSANAQIKQALGSLRAAQANYNKTVLRSPIAGVVNSINIKTGDFLSGFQTVAEIANNEALEVTTYVGQSDRDSIAVQQEVRIKDSITGVISAIAPAVNNATGKIEVKIQTTSSDLVNGDTVTITLGTQANGAGDRLIQVPLTAVKFNASAGVVYTVEDGVLVAYDVEIGEVRNTNIEIISGITSSMEIVTDARGLNAGEAVTVVVN